MRPFPRSAAALLAALVFTGSAAAQDHIFSIRPQSQRLQTGPSTFSAGIFFMGLLVDGRTPAPSPPYTSATITKPDASTVSLSQPEPNQFLSIFQFGTLDAMRTAYPSGTYSAALAPNGLPLADAVVPANYAPPVFPEFTNYDAIQELNPRQDFTFTFPAFTGSTPLTSGIALAVIDMTSGDEVFVASLEATATQYTMPANTLAEGRPYTAALIYSDQVYFDFVFDEVNFTYFNFTDVTLQSINLVTFTPTPEPSTVLGLAAVGLGAVALRRRKVRLNTRRSDPDDLAHEAVSGG
jgi:hypothetical protein